MSNGKTWSQGDLRSLVYPGKTAQHQPVVAMLEIQNSPTKRLTGISLGQCRCMKLEYLHEHRVGGRNLRAATDDR